VDKQQNRFGINGLQNGQPTGQRVLSRGWVGGIASDPVDPVGSCSRAVCLL